MFNKQNSLRLIILLLIFGIILLIISGRGCPKRGRGTKIGSSNEWAGIVAPSSLTATAFSYSEIRLSWQDNSDNEDAFRIERSTSGIDYLLLATVYSNITSYSDIDAIPLTTYYYRVRASNNIGDYSGYTNVVTMSLQPSGWLVLSAGESHSLALANDRTIWGWGDNQFGQLEPANSVITFTRPALLSNDTDWSKIRAGYYHTVGIKTNSTIWSWGNNDYGQLGLGSTDYFPAPAEVGTDSDWVIVSAGEYHTIALKTNQTLWSWGDNTFGQLGLGDTAITPSVFIPTQVGTDSDWLIANGTNFSSLDAGARHNLALKTNGTLWAWGYNEFGQLGEGIVFGGDRTTPRSIGTDSDWLSIAGGSAHSLGLKTAATLWKWGNSAMPGASTPEQVGSDRDWAMIIAGGAMEFGMTGYSFSFAFKTNSTLWAWGQNNYGQLGLGDYYDRTTPTQVNQSQTEWVTVAAGNYHSLSINNLTGGQTGNQIYVWGRNQNCQLGLGDTINRNFPNPLGSPPPPSYLIIALTDTSQIGLTWTDNSDNEEWFKIERKLNRNGTYVQIATVGPDVVSYSDITPVSAGSYYYYRIRTYNSFGNSPYSNEAVTAISGNWSFQSGLDAGWEYTVALKSDKIIWAWGSNSSGQLGTNDTMQRDSPTQSIMTTYDWSAIAAGGNHTIALKTDKTLWVWGQNSYGQLGLGDTIQRNSPTQSIMTTSDWSIIAAGDSHTIALKTDKTLWVWGWNYLGQLGLGDTAQRNSPTQSIMTTSDWSAIAAGGNHTIALKTDKTLWVWGQNNYGQLGLGDTIKRNSPTQSIMTTSDWSVIAAGWYHTVALKTDKTLWTWGTNTAGQLGTDDTTQRNSPTQSIMTTSDWSIITAGGNHTIALKTDKTLWVWGWNADGQLGTNDTIQRNSPTQNIMTTSDWSAIAAGFAHTIALRSNATIWAWGRNDSGQLGLGDIINRNIPTLVGE